MLSVHAAPPAPAHRRADRTPASRPAAPVVQRLAGNRAPGGVRVQACGCGGTCASCAEKEERVQPALAVGPADDVYEREAQQTAERVVRMPAPQASAAPEAGTAAPAIQRIAAGAAYGMRMDAPLPMGGGRPLSPGTRAFMEPRLGADFGHVRLHAGAEAERTAEGIGARAFTHGADVWLGRGASEGDRGLMAHELAHVVQQGGGAAPAAVQRQPVPAAPGAAVPSPAQPAAPVQGAPPAAGPYTVHPSCAVHAADLRPAWDEGARLTRDTIGTLETVVTMARMGESALARMPRVAGQIQNAFGDIAGLEGEGFTNIPNLIERYEKILAGFTAGKVLRCDTSTVNNGTECNLFAAFVVPGNSTDIFLCPSFFAGTGAVRDTQRGGTLLHEMAHSVLHAGHEGTGDSLTFGCDTSLGLTYDDARRNAYAYDTLAMCLHGTPVQGESVTVPVPPGAASPGAAGDRRFSLGVGVGGRLLDDGRQLATMLSGTLSLRTGEFVVFNPIIGLNLVYAPSLAGSDAGHLGTLALGAGIRIQQPLEGAYLDLLGGGFVGFEADPGKGTRAVGGLDASVGGGYRWNRFELGGSVGGQLHLEDAPTVDRGSLLIIGRGAVRF
jgi:hypothetical protein